jgi:hypothetical protein
VETQNSIRSTLDGEHVPVRSVTCTPHIGDLAWTDPPAHLRCLVRFENRASYTTPVTVQPVVDQPDALTWNDPPPGVGNVDITTAPLPSPSSSVSATSAGSLFYARNLRPVVAALNSRFHGQSIVQFALYTGELESVIANGNGEARLVTADRSGKLTVGPPSSFNGARNSIYAAQLNWAVPERLARLISLRGGVPTARLARFVLYFTAKNAGWNIYQLSGATRFQALLQGDALTAISPAGERPLN